MTRVTYSLLAFCTLLLLWSPAACLKEKENKMKTAGNLAQLVDALGLEQHVEGGYFRQTYKAGSDTLVKTPFGDRVTMTSIYYLLTSDSPVGHFHLNRSDIMHYFHLGDPITYYLIYPDGRLETRTLGPDVLNGHELQFVVEGGVWKASKIAEHNVNGYGLIGEAVAPGFEYEDMQLAKPEDLIEAFPQHSDLINALSR